MQRRIDFPKYEITGERVDGLHGSRLPVLDSFLLLSTEALPALA
jgi:hypothetical protein